MKTRENTIGKTYENSLEVLGECEKLKIENQQETLGD